MSDAWLMDASCEHGITWWECEQCAPPASVAVRLRSTREASGLSLRAVARAAVVPVPTLSRWELGGSLPSLDGIERLAAVLGVAPGWLAFGSGAADTEGTTP